MRLRFRLVEFWVSVPGYEGIYEVSSHGRVRRISKAQGTTGGILATGTGKYANVVLSKDGNVKNFSVHVLVCLAFHGPKPSPEHEVNHKNGLKRDNFYMNVHWVTKCENMQHAVKEGLHVPPDVSKSYILTSPQGKTIKVKGLVPFCKKRDLDASTLISVAKGKSSNHKGWLCHYDIGRTDPKGKKSIRID